MRTKIIAKTGTKQCSVPPRAACEKMPMGGMDGKGLQNHRIN